MRNVAVIALPFFFALLSGCADAPACEPGTVREGDRCVAEEVDAGARDAGRDAGPDAGTALDAGVDGGSELDAGGTADSGAAADAGGTPPPVFPSTIDHLSFAIRTGDGPNAGADGTAVSLCLNDTRCFPLDVPDVNDFRRGAFDVYHFENVDLPRTAVDRVELRWGSGADAWQPACVEVRFDGEPVHCQGGLDVSIGNGAGDRMSWRDPAGLHETCGTCYPARVTHGPLVGAVTADSARVLVRTDATRPVTLQVTDPSSPTPRIIGPQYPGPRNDYTTTFVIDGLRPRTNYTAHVHVGGTRIGRAATFRTAARVDAASAFRVGFGSCANNTNFPVQPIFRELDERNLDLFLFLGDNHYGNTGNAQAQWFNYRQTLDMPARAAFLASTPSLATWDDHDYVGNNTTRHSAGRAAALRAFTDYWANPSFGTAAQPGVFFETSYGDVDFFVLDGRYERDRPGTGGSMLGAAQEAWLEAALRRSTAAFRVIVSGSTFSRGGGETWLDYPEARARLFSFIRTQDIGGVVFLAGDVHRTHFRWIHRAHYDIPELVSSGLATYEEGACPGPDAAEPDAAQVYCTQTAPTFIQLDIDTTRADPRIIARVIGDAGNELRTMTILRSQLR